MTKPIYVLNGPNLNRLGKREPEIYGTTTLAEIEAMCREAAGERPIALPPVQLRERRSSTGSTRRSTRAPASSSIPAGFTFTSIAILDALKMFPGPIIELHISNIHRREDDLPPFLGLEGGDRRLAGLGAGGYPMAVARSGRHDRGRGIW